MAGLATIDSSLADAQRMIALLEDRASDLTDVWPRIGKIYADRERRLFTSGLRRTWAPLKKSTILAKRREGFAGRGILVRTGQLMQAVQNPAPLKDGPRFGVFGITPGLSSAQKTASWMRKGTKKMAQRNPIPALDNVARGQVAKAIVQWIEEGAAHVT